jgi:hypothetical protein
LTAASDEDLGSLSDEGLSEDLTAAASDDDFAPLSDEDLTSLTDDNENNDDGDADPTLASNIAAAIRPPAPRTAPASTGRTGSTDTLALDTSSTSVNAAALARAASLNRALISVSLAPSVGSALRKAGDYLVDAGISHGLTLVVDAKSNAKANANSPRALGVWERTADATNVRTDDLGGFLSSALSAVWARPTTEWSAVTQDRNAGPMKPFQAWQSGHKLMTAAFPAAPGKTLVVIAAWTDAALAEPMLRSLSLDYFRRLATRAKGA